MEAATGLSPSRTTPPDRISFAPGMSRYNRSPSDMQLSVGSDTLLVMGNPGFSSAYPARTTILLTFGVSGGLSMGGNWLSRPQIRYWERGEKRKIQISIPNKKKWDLVVKKIQWKKNKQVCLLNRKK